MQNSWVWEQSWWIADHLMIAFLMGIRSTDFLLRRMMPSDEQIERTAWLLELSIEGLKIFVWKAQRLALQMRQKAFPEFK